MDFIKEIEFVKSIKFKDFLKAFILQEDDGNTIWLIIDDARFKNNKKYYHLEWEYQEKNNCYFNIVMFSECRMKDIREQLKYMGDYIEIE